MNTFTKVLMASILLTSLLASSTLNDTTKSIVKIFVTKSIVDYGRPWQTSNIANAIGSGAIIKGNYILTAAHVVTDAKLLQVKKENDPQKYIATLKYISHQADLAILEIKDKNFFNKTKQLQLSTNVKVRDSVTVVGYPVGGENVSTTTGIISRIEQVYYVYSIESLLAIQIDAAVNSGNSGGPVVNDKNELIGIVMMSNTKASNISYIVPTEIINTFLDDIKDNKVDGFNRDDNYFSPIENQTMKEYYGLNNGNGIVISKVGKYNENMKNNDVLLAIDGNKIANNGTIKTQYGRISFSHIYNTKQIGDTVVLDVLRDKKKIKVIETIKRIPDLIEFEFKRTPRYIMYGGLVLTPITKNYLGRISKLEADKLEKKLYAKKKIDTYEEAITMMGASFPHEVNRGYGNWARVLKSVNGIKIHHFKHLVQVLDGMKDTYTTFEFFETSNIVLNTQKAKKSIKEIMKIYRLSSDRSVE